MSIKGKHLPFFLLSILLLIYTGYRAMHLSLTHDEGSTFLNHIRWGYFECYFNPECWAAANNHLLNTAGIKFFTSFLGSSEWVIRLPNWLSHALYLGASAVLVTRISNERTLQIFGFVLMNLLPILLEFFGLARGYAMGTAFAMVALTCFILAIDKRTSKWVWMATIAGLLSVYSNFTFAIYFVASVGTFGLLMLIDHRKWSQQTIQRSFVAMISISILTVLTTYTPLKALSENGEFLWGTDTLFQAFESLTVENSYGHRWYPVSTTILTWLFLTMILTSAGIAIYRWFVTPKGNATHLFAAILFVVLTLGVFLNHILLDAKYPVGRKMFMFIPPMTLLIYQLVVLIGEKRKRIGSALAMLGIGLLVFHFLRTINFSQTRTWYYDAHTKAMMTRVADEVSHLDQQASLGVFWIYSPASKYYVETSEISLARYERLNQIDGDSSFDFYYVEKGHVEALKEQYDILEDANGHVLLRHRRFSNE